MSYNRKRPADTQEDAWVADEDRFVLQQAKKKAAIRVKEGRAKPIDWLAVTLRFIEPSRNPFDDEVKDVDLDIVDPEGVFESMDSAQLNELEKDINMYISLEKNKTNLDFWNTMSIIANDRREKLQPSAPNRRSQEATSAEVDRIFGSKTYEQLEALEKQIQTKLRSHEDIDVEYWENLLRGLKSWKARAKLRQVSQSIVKNQLQGLREQQGAEAQRVKEGLTRALGSSGAAPVTSQKVAHVDYSALDPEPLLKARAEDKGLQVQDQSAFTEALDLERRKVRKLGYVPVKRNAEDGRAVQSQTNMHMTPASITQGSASDELARTTNALYDREVARGVGENEEVFAAEEEVSAVSKPQWANKYRPRKPRYFNRVQMGFEWNKYNQTHYDHDNPPPKIVQGYKFNIFYPDLIDNTKAPTYKIVREGGRKRGESFAPAGEDDTCLIKFIAGPPYEDVAFRIVDKEWDYSAKRDRGFRSSFDKGILQLHFQFKKIFYRK